MGMEVSFTQQDTAEHVENIPFGITSLTIFGGTLKYWINPAQAGHSEVLVRISIIGDSRIDGGSGPGSFLILNYDLPTADGLPTVLTIPLFTVPCSNGAVPVPPDGSPYQFKVSVGAAGAIWPTDCEIELCGRWTA